MAKMKGSTEWKKSGGHSFSPVSPLPLARAEDKGEGLELTHVTLLGLTLTLPLSLRKGEAFQARMRPIFTYRSAN